MASLACYPCDTDDPTSRDVSRPTATGRDADYTLSLDDVAQRYAQAGHARTLRTLQRYCASGHLEAQKVATALGDKYLVTPQSVARHIAQIEELGALNPVAASRDVSRPVAARSKGKSSDSTTTAIFYASRSRPKKCRSPRFSSATARPISLSAVCRS